MVTPERVADFVLTSLLAKTTVAVMDLSARALACARALAPAMIDCLVLRRLGPLLRQAFGRAGRFT